MLPGDCCTTLHLLRKLWAADLPVVAMRVRDLDGHQTLALRPRDVAAHPECYQADYLRARAANLSCPINVIYLRGQWVVMDGLHRLLKAWMLDRETILAKQAHEQHIPLFRRQPTDPSNHPLTRR